jgi:hypothetical protein
VEMLKNFSTLTPHGQTPNAANGAHSSQPTS